MSSAAGAGEGKARQVVADTSDRVEEDQYDRGIIPAETAARMERENAAYKHKPTESADADPESIRTTDGYTVDKEGLVNNYAIEPEMYVNEPGDLRQEKEQLAAERAQELSEVNEDSQGNLTMEDDKRGRGPGII